MMNPCICFLYFRAFDENENINKYFLLRTLAIQSWWHPKPDTSYLTPDEIPLAITIIQTSSSSSRSSFPAVRRVYLGATLVE